jgi:hypothetical protein
LQASFAENSRAMALYMARKKLMEPHARAHARKKIDSFASHVRIHTCFIRVHRKTTAINVRR